MLRLCLFLFGVSTVFAAQEEVWLSHYTREGGGFFTSIDLVNTDFSSSHEVVLTPYSEAGTVLAESSKTVTIAAGHRLKLNRADLDWVGKSVSHLHVSKPEQVRASAGYRAELANAMVAQIPLRADLTLTARLLPEVNPIWFDGLVAVNPGPLVASLVLSAHDAMGNTIRSTEVSLNPSAKWLGVARSIFGVDLPSDGYLQMSASQPLLFLALRGSGPEIEVPVLTEVALDRFESIPAPVTFSNQISRIMMRDCAYCHHDNGIGPFSLSTYEEVDPLRSYLYEAVSNGSMPPWKASLDCEPLVDHRSMDPLEKEMLLSWLLEQESAGDKNRQPVEPEWPVDWELGPPDQTVSYLEDFVFEPGADVYRCFPMALNNSEEIQLEAFEILPGNPSIVHHVLVFISETNEGQSLDSGEAGPGYTCFGGPGTENIRLLAGWAPGGQAQIMPDGVGMTLKPNSTLIVQVHYHYSEVAGTDRTRVGLYFSDVERSKELLLLPIVNQNFIIPAGADDYLVTQEFTLPFGLSVDLYGIAPHMHLLGKSSWTEVRYPSGEESCLIDVPKWDFNWQGAYAFQEPIHLPGGSRLKMSCLFDNSENNPNNPYSPPQAVGWGEATTDEMALTFLGVVLPNFFKMDDLNGWSWPFSLKRQARNPQLPDPRDLEIFRKQPVPSCCQPGGEKPWAKCPSLVDQK